jgi:hypothetical protein
MDQTFCGEISVGNLIIKSGKWFAVRVINSKELKRGRCCAPA